MIRYIAVTAVKNGDEVIHIPETLVESMSKIDNGRAEIVYRESREDDTSEAYSKTSDWRITGYAAEKGYSIMPYDDLIAWLNGIPPEPMVVDFDRLSPEERENVMDNLVAARHALRNVNSKTVLQPAPAHHVGLDSDVWAVVKLLEDREWAEHCTTTELGGRLESEITKLVGTENETAGKLKRAEQLLAEIHHAVNNDGGLYPIGPDADLVARLSEYLYPAE